MARPKLIEFVNVSLSDGPRLIVLKSRYNRYAAQLNREIIGGVKWGIEEEELLVQVKYLKEQIDQYE